MGFADLIRKRVQAGLQGADVQGGPFLDVLRELAEGLTSDRVGAAITRGGVRGRFYLTLWPRSLPAKRQLLLAFGINTRSVRVFADPPQDFTDTDGLRDWLTDFVTSPSFLESVEILSDTTRHPAEGYLRARSAGQLTRDDVVVEIPADVQAALVDQPDESPVDITVALAATAGAGTFDPQRRYVTLESSGVRVDEVRAEVLPDGLLRIGGVKRLEQDLRSDFEAASRRTEAFDELLDERVREMKKYGSP